MQEVTKLIPARESLDASRTKVPSVSSTKADCRNLNKHKCIGFLKKRLSSFINIFKKIFICFGRKSKEDEGGGAVNSRGGLFTFCFRSKDKISPKNDNIQLSEFISSGSQQESLNVGDTAQYIDNHNKLLNFIKCENYPKSLNVENSVRCIIKYIQDNKLNLSWTQCVDQDKPPLILEIFTLNHRIGTQLLTQETGLKNLKTSEIQELLSYLYEHTGTEYWGALRALISNKNLFFDTKFTSATEQLTLLKLLIQKMWLQNPAICGVAVMQILSNPAAKQQWQKYPEMGCSKDGAAESPKNYLTVHFDPETNRTSIIPKTTDIDNRGTDNNDCNALTTQYNKQVFENCKKLLLDGQKLSAQERFKDFDWRTLHCAFHPDIARLVVEQGDVETFNYLVNRLIPSAWECTNEEMHNSGHIAIKRDDSQILHDLFTKIPNLTADYCQELYLEYAIDCGKKNSFHRFLGIRLKEHANVALSNDSISKTEFKKMMEDIKKECEIFKTRICTTNIRGTSDSDLEELRKEMLDILEQEKRTILDDLYNKSSKPSTEQASHLQSNGQGGGSASSFQTPNESNTASASAISKEFVPSDVKPTPKLSPIVNSLLKYQPDYKLNSQNINWINEWLLHDNVESLYGKQLFTEQILDQSGEKIPILLYLSIYYPGALWKAVSEGVLASFLERKMDKTNINFLVRWEVSYYNKIRNNDPKFKENRNLLIVRSPQDDQEYGRYDLIGILVRNHFISWDNPPKADGKELLSYLAEFAEPSLLWHALCSMCNNNKCIRSIKLIDIPQHNKIFTFINYFKSLGPEQLLVEQLRFSSLYIQKKLIQKYTPSFMDRNKNPRDDLLPAEEMVSIIVHLIGNQPANENALIWTIIETPILEEFKERIIEKIIPKIVKEDDSHKLQFLLDKPWICTDFSESSQKIFSNVLFQVLKANSPQCLKQLPSFLMNWLKNDQFFEIMLPINKIMSSEWTNILDQLSTTDTRIDLEVRKNILGVMQILEFIAVNRLLAKQNSPQGIAENVDVSTIIDTVTHRIGIYRKCDYEPDLLIKKLYDLQS